MASLRMPQHSLTLMSFLTEVLMQRMLLRRVHSSTNRSSTAIPRSHLLPISMNSASGDFAFAISYHLVVALRKVCGLPRSNITMMPWQPLKQLETMARYFSCPAVSQMKSLMELPSILVSLILKSMVVTLEDFSARNSPSMYLQKSVVLPTEGSPIIMILYLGSFPTEKYRSSIICCRLISKYETNPPSLTLKQVLMRFLPCLGRYRNSVR